MNKEAERFAVKLFVRRSKQQSFSSSTYCFHERVLNGLAQWVIFLPGVSFVNIN